MKSPKRLLGRRLPLLAVLTLLSGLTLQAQAPESRQPILTEAVFPGVSFGELGEVSVVAVLSVTNLGEQEAYARFELFTASGQAAFLEFDGNERAYRALTAIAIPPRTSRTIEYNGRYRLVSPSFFQGWGRLEANQQVRATVSMRTFRRDSGGLVPEVVLNGVGRRLNSVRLPVGGAVGVALAVPGSAGTRTLSVQMLVRPDRPFGPPDSAVPVASTTVTIPGNGQIAMLASELFPGQSPDYLLVSTEDVRGFAATAIGVGDCGVGGLPCFYRPSFYSLTGEENYVYEDGLSWDFDPAYGTVRQVGGTTLRPTIFGVYVESSSGPTPRFFSFAAPEIHLDDQLELAVVGDDRAKIIVFADGTVIEEPLPDQDLTISVLNDGLIEIRAQFLFSVGLTAVGHKDILIDPESRSIVGRFAGPIDSIPPWR